jgi:hypothetical protein
MEAFTPAFVLVDAADAVLFSLGPMTVTFACPQTT